VNVGGMGEGVAVGGAGVGAGVHAWTKAVRSKNAGNIDSIDLFITSPSFGAQNLAGARCVGWLFFHVSDTYGPALNVCMLCSNMANSSLYLSLLGMYLISQIVPLS